MSTGAQSDNPHAMLTPSVSVVDQVFAKLKIAIITGDTPSGCKINELELARQYDVSRSTIREAIGRLESSHLVTRKPNVGAHVVLLSAKALMDIFLVRESLEGMACRLAAENMTNDQIDELVNVVADEIKTGKMIEDVILQQQQDGKMDFHHLIIQGSGNSKLIEILFDELYPQISMYRYQFAIGSPRVITGFNEHQNIMNSIQARDGEMAEILMRLHIRASRLSIEQRLQYIGQNSDETCGQE